MFYVRQSGAAGIIDAGVARELLPTVPFPKRAFQDLSRWPRHTCRLSVSSKTSGASKVGGLQPEIMPPQGEGAPGERKSQPCWGLL